MTLALIGIREALLLPAHDGEAAEGRGAEPGEWSQGLQQGQAHLGAGPLRRDGRRLDLGETDNRGASPRRASGGVQFKVIERAKLHKNVLYGDEAWAEEHVERAARVMRDRYRPGCG